MLFSNGVVFYTLKLYCEIVFAIDNKRVKQSLICRLKKYHLDDFPTGDSYLDSREQSWSEDRELKPMDLNKLIPRSLVIYKFGCHVAQLIARRCQHAPVNILLAESIPSNPDLTHNMYRNSFAFDANNRILYIRAARLDTVGEYILVLTHCLAHIKSGGWCFLDKS